MAWTDGDPKRREDKARRLRVLRRADGQCQIRGPHCVGHAVFCDHIIPLAAGGPDTDGNCQAACQPCHADKTLGEIADGKRRRAERGRHPVETHPGLG